MFTLYTDNQTIHYERGRGMFLFNKDGEKVAAPPLEAVFKTREAEERIGKFYLSTKHPWVPFSRLPRYYTPAQIVGVEAFEISNKDESMSTGKLAIPTGCPITAILAKRGRMWRLFLVYTKASYYKDIAANREEFHVFPRYSRPNRHFELTKEWYSKRLHCGLNPDHLKGLKALEDVFALNY